MRERTTTATLQMAKLTAAIPAIATSGGNGGGGERKPNRDGGPRKKREPHTCKHCKRAVYHKDDNCMELPANATDQHDGWVSYLAQPLT